MFSHFHIKVLYTVRSVLVTHYYLSSCTVSCIIPLMMVAHMLDMSTLIRRCENFGLFYNFCSQLIEALEY